MSAASTEREGPGILDERPSKRPRVDNEAQRDQTAELRVRADDVREEDGEDEQEGDEQTFGAGHQAETARASDLYLDTVRFRHSLLSFPLNTR